MSESKGLLFPFVLNEFLHDNPVEHTRLMHLFELRLGQVQKGELDLAIYQEKWKSLPSLRPPPLVQRAEPEYSGYSDWEDCW